MLRLSSLPHPATCLFGAVFARKPAIAADASLPQLSLHVARVTPEPARIAAYRKSLGFAAALPLAWIYLPVQRAQLVLINRPEFPLRAAGLIHVANRIEQLTEITPHPMAIHVEMGDQTVRRSGRQFELIAHVEQDGREVARVSSRYLAPAPRIRGASRAPQRPAPEAGRQIATIAANAGYGWRYARVSGDWNPIHLHPWLARSFGLRRPIAHGMAVAAEALAALEREHGAVAHEFAVDFLKPVPLPSTLECEAMPGTDGFALAQVRIGEEIAQRVKARF